MIKPCNSAQITRSKACGLLEFKVNNCLKDTNSSASKKKDWGQFFGLEIWEGKSV